MARRRIQANRRLLKECTEVRVDLKAARRVLHHETGNPAPAPQHWIGIVEQLSTMCEAGAPKTHIAMLGTALLAKATEPRVDVFALKVSAGTKGAYSARNLAKEVLAAEAPRLGIDLGVTGREPLNNQPYFREARITPEFESIIRGDGLPPFRLVYSALERLAKATPEEAKGALRAFLRGRRRASPKPLDGDTRVVAAPSQVASKIAAFVADRSEGGRRAQSLAAALLDQLFGPERVEIARVNDPDRHFPGDVAVRQPEAPFSVVRVYEVRDKPVAEHDLLHFVDKAYSHKAVRAAVICVHPSQPPLDLKFAADAAFERGIALRVFMSWEELVADILFTSDEPPRAVLQEVGLSAHERMVELEVSTSGLALWGQIIRELAKDL
jgi:hypothetical protein